MNVATRTLFEPNHMKSYLTQKNLHLIISILVIIPAGFMYGLFPEKVLPQLLDIQTFSVDLIHIFRAIMCLYFGIAGVWILGVLRPDYWRFATILAMVFMGCLMAGRIISFIFDGIPSLLFTLGVMGECVLAVFSWYQLKRYAA